MIDELIQEKGRILDQEFYKSIENVNDGLNIEKIQNENQTYKQHNDLVQKKQYLTNKDWERDRTLIMNQLSNFHNIQFQQLEINQTIKDDYKIGFEISQKSRQRLEEKEKEYLYQTRKIYQDAKKLLQYFYDDQKKKNHTNEYQQNKYQLQEIIKELKILIQKTQYNIIDKDKYKIMILEDLQKQIEKSLNEILFY